MPASNSEARKRHEEKAKATAQAAAELSQPLAEAMSNVASGVVLEPLPSGVRAMQSPARSTCAHGVSLDDPCTWCRNRQVFSMLVDRP